MSRSSVWARYVAVLTLLCFSYDVRSADIVCGEPKYNKAREQGVFLWKNCESGAWSVRATAGRDTSSPVFAGTVQSDQAFASVTPNGIDSRDTLDYTTDLTLIRFELEVKRPLVDGFDFVTASGSANCLDGTALPPGGRVYVGAGKVPLTPPFSLETLGSCDDAANTMSIDDVVGTEGVGKVRFMVRLAKRPSQVVTVDYATVSGTATENVDYTSMSGSLRFDPVLEETSKTVEVPILQDQDPESSEDFSVVLSGAVGGVLADDTGVGTIEDDDADPCGSSECGDNAAVSIDNVSVNENDGVATFTVSLTATPSQLVTVDYATVAGTATENVDYMGTSGSLSFDPALSETSKTFEVTILSDTQTEGAEVFTVVLSNATVAIENDTGVGTINDSQSEREFPQLGTFRTLHNSQSDEILHTHGLFDWIHAPKYSVSAAQRFKQLYPDVPVIAHVNYQQPGYVKFPGLPKFSAAAPGHWLFALGSDTKPGAWISSSATRIYVVSNNYFHSTKVEDAAIMSIGADGRPDWNKYEEIRVVGKGSDAQGPYVDVTRGVYGTSPKGFNGSSSRIMLHVTGFQNGPRDERTWEYNVSPMAPAAPDGNPSAYHLAKYFAARLNTLHDAFDGLEFDYPKWSAFHHTERSDSPDIRGVPIDCDLDGIGDDCYVSGVNTYAVGIMSFMRLLREGADFAGIGYQRILQADRHALGPMYLNGYEWENFPAWGAIWPKKLTRAFNFQQQALDVAGVAPRWSYVQLKDTVEAVDDRCSEPRPGTNNRFRAAFASALIMGNDFTYVPGLDDAACNANLGAGPVIMDEYRGGQLNRWHYLGRPVGSARRVLSGLASQNLMPSGDFESAAAVGAWRTTAYSGASVAGPTRDTATAAGGSASLRVQVNSVGSQRPANGRVRLISPGFQVVSGEMYTLRIRMRATNGYGAYHASYADALREVDVRFAAGNGIPMAQAYPGPQQWSDYLFTFEATTSRSDATLELRMGHDSGSVWIDDVVLQRGCGMLAVREFEHGIALLNGCPARSSFDLASLFPGESFRRLQGTQDPVVNDGSTVGATVELPRYDGLVLLKN